MASEKQRSAARKNIKKAAAAAKTKRTIAHLPKAVRTALGKQAAKVRKRQHASLFRLQFAYTLQNHVPDNSQAFRTDLVHCVLWRMPIAG